MQQVFPGMPASHPTFKQAVIKVHDLYKTWKNHTLNDAHTVFEELIVSGLSQLQNKRRLKVIGMNLTINFNKSWLPYIFGWTDKVVTFDDCSHMGIYWLRCMAPFPPA